MNTIICGDSLVELKKLEDEGVDLVCCDPPYSIGFMGKSWDKTLPDIGIFRECFRVLKPGAFAFVMSAPRSDVCARMMLMLEDAGFEIGFTPIYWTYASGFPKAMNIGKMVDKRLGVEREITGTRKSAGGRSGGSNEFGVALASIPKTVDITAPATDQAKALDGSYGGFQPKPAVEVVIVAMKPLSEKTFVDQALKNGKGITWLDDCKIPYADEADKATATPGGRVTSNKAAGAAPDIDNAGRVEIERPELLGRFSANLLVSDKVLGSYSRYYDLDNWNCGVDEKLSRLAHNQEIVGANPTPATSFPFLIVPKASKREKGGDNKHPTVKPLTLMSYLITLGSRPGDTVLDPFLGSGTTALAAKQLGRKYIGIEREKEYVEIAKARLSAVENTLL